MANDAYYEMNVMGKKSAVDEFIRAMEGKDEYTDNGVGRVSCEVFRKHDNDDGTVTYSCAGDCAWSILCAMRDNGRPNNIESLSERLGLEIEAYSEEYGIGFHEHVYINHGIVEVDECVDAYEFNVDDIDDDIIWDMPKVRESGITKENYMEYAEDGYIRVGGLEWNFDYVD